VNANHSTPRTWYFAAEGPWGHKPSGKGPRLIIVHAMTTAGWVEGAQLVLQAKRRTGDYHGQMDFENFRRWFLDCLLPHIPAASLIVMENARPRSPRRPLSATRHGGRDPQTPSSSGA
jgi:hypothetical protein